MKVETFGGYSVKIIKFYLREIGFWWADITHNNWREYAQSDHDYNVAERKQRRS